MGISQETFDQVKNILRKLDRSIDAARSERLEGSKGPGGDVSRPANNGSSGSQTPGRARPMERPEPDVTPGGFNRAGMA